MTWTSWSDGISIDYHPWYKCSLLTFSGKHSRKCANRDWISPCVIILLIDIFMIDQFIDRNLTAFAGQPPKGNLTQTSSVSVCFLVISTPKKIMYTMRAQFWVKRLMFDSDWVRLRPDSAFSLHLRRSVCELSYDSNFSPTGSGYL